MSCCKYYLEIVEGEGVAFHNTLVPPAATADTSDTPMMMMLEDTMDCRETSSSKVLHSSCRSFSYSISKVW